MAGNRGWYVVVRLGLGCMGMYSQNGEWRCNRWWGKPCHVARVSHNCSQNPVGGPAWEQAGWCEVGVSGHRKPAGVRNAAFRRRPVRPGEVLQAKWGQLVGRGWAMAGRAVVPRA